MKDNKKEFRSILLRLSTYELDQLAKVKEIEGNLVSRNLIIRRAILHYLIFAYPEIARREDKWQNWTE